MNEKLMAIVRDYPPEQTDEQVFENLSAENIPFTDNTLYSYRELVKRFGPEITAAVLGALEAAGANNPLLKITYSALAAQGIDFSDPDAQGMITALESGGVFTSQQATALREIGVRNISFLEREGLADVTLEDVAQARLDEARRFAQTEALSGLYLGCLVEAKTGSLTRATLQPLYEALNTAALGD